MTELGKEKSVKQAVRGAFCCQNCQIAFSAFDGIFQPEKNTAQMCDLTISSPMDLLLP